MQSRNNKFTITALARPGQKPLIVPGNRGLSHPTNPVTQAPQRQADGLVQNSFNVRSSLKNQAKARPTDSEATDKFMIECIEKFRRSQFTDESLRTLKWDDYPDLRSRLNFIQDFECGRRGNNNYQLDWVQNAFLFLTAQERLNRSSSNKLKVQCRPYVSTASPLPSPETTYEEPTHQIKTEEQPDVVMAAPIIFDPDNSVNPGRSEEVEHHKARVKQFLEQQARETTGSKPVKNSRSDPDQFMSEIQGEIDDVVQPPQTSDRWKSRAGQNREGFSFSDDEEEHSDWSATDEREFDQIPIYVAMKRVPRPLAMQYIKDIHLHGPNAKPQEPGASIDVEKEGLCRIKARELLIKGNESLRKCLDQNGIDIFDFASPSFDRKGLPRVPTRITVTNPNSANPDTKIEFPRASFFGRFRFEKLDDYLKPSAKIFEGVKSGFTDKALDETYKPLFKTLLQGENENRLKDLLRIGPGMQRNCHHLSGDISNNGDGNAKMYSKFFKGRGVIEMEYASRKMVTQDQAAQLVNSALKLGCFPQDTGQVGFRQWSAAANPAKSFCNQMDNPKSTNAAQSSLAVASNDLMGVENSAQLIEHGIRCSSHLLLRIMRVAPICKSVQEMKAVIGCVQGINQLEIQHLTERYWGVIAEYGERNSWAKEGFFTEKVPYSAESDYELPGTKSIEWSKRLPTLNPKNKQGMPKFNSSDKNFNAYQQYRFLQLTKEYQMRLRNSDKINSIKGTYKWVKVATVLYPEGRQEQGLADSRLRSLLLNLLSQLANVDKLQHPHLVVEFKAKKPSLRNNQFDNRKKGTAGTASDYEPVDPCDTDILNVITSVCIDSQGHLRVRLPRNEIDTGTETQNTFYNKGKEDDHEWMYACEGSHCGLSLVFKTCSLGINKGQQIANTVVKSVLAVESAGRDAKTYVNHTAVQRAEVWVMQYTELKPEEVTADHIMTVLSELAISNDDVRHLELIGRELELSKIATSMQGQIVGINQSVPVKYDPIIKFSNDMYKNTGFASPNIFYFLKKLTGQAQSQVCLDAGPIERRYAKIVLDMANDSQKHPRLTNNLTPQNFFKGANLLEISNQLPTNLPFNPTIFVLAAVGNQQTEKAICLFDFLRKVVVNKRYSDQITLGIQRLGELIESGVFPVNSAHFAAESHIKPKLASAISLYSDVGYPLQCSFLLKDFIDMMSSAYPHLKNPAFIVQTGLKDFEHSVDRSIITMIIFILNLQQDRTPIEVFTDVVNNDSIGNWLRLLGIGLLYVPDIQPPVGDQLSWLRDRNLVENKSIQQLKAYDIAKGKARIQDVHGFQLNDPNGWEDMQTRFRVRQIQAFIAVGNYPNQGGKISVNFQDLKFNPYDAADIGNYVACENSEGQKVMNLRSLKAQQKKTVDKNDILKKLQDPQTQVFDLDGNAEVMQRQLGVIYQLSQAKPNTLTQEQLNELMGQLSEQQRKMIPSIVASGLLDAPAVQNREEQGLLASVVEGSGVQGQVDTSSDSPFEIDPYPSDMDALLEAETRALRTQQEARMSGQAAVTIDTTTTNELPKPRSTFYASDDFVFEYWQAVSRQEVIDDQQVIYEALALAHFEQTRDEDAIRFHQDRYEEQQLQEYVAIMRNSSAGNPVQDTRTGQEIDQSMQEQDAQGSATYVQPAAEQFLPVTGGAWGVNAAGMTLPVDDGDIEMREESAQEPEDNRMEWAFTHFQGQEGGEDELSEQSQSSSQDRRQFMDQWAGYMEDSE